MRISVEVDVSVACPDDQSFMLLSIEEEVLSSAISAEKQNKI
jgi:hypothetical protein